MFLIGFLFGGFHALSKLVSDSIPKHDHLLGRGVHVFPLILHLLHAFFDGKLEVVQAVKQPLNENCKTFVVLDAGNDLAESRINLLLGGIDVSQFQNVIAVLRKDLGVEVGVKYFVPLDLVEIHVVSARDV